MTVAWMVEKKEQGKKKTDDLEDSGEVDLTHHHIQHVGFIEPARSCCKLWWRFVAAWRNA